MMDTLYTCTNENITLGIDEACFTISNLYYYPIILYAIAWDAYTGTGVPMATVPPDKNVSLILSTKYPVHMYYQTVEGNRSLEYCHTTYYLKEHGSYQWNVTGSGMCSLFRVIHEPSGTDLSILFACMIYMLLFTLWKTSKVLIRVIRGKLSPDNIPDDLDRLQETESTAPAIRTTKSSTRIRSVDTFRGIAILLMIFVNNGAGKYVFFNHSAWYGLKLADVVLPWFAWIMGFTITISKRAELRITTSRVKMVLRCLRRSVILMMLGLMLNSINSKSLYDLRFPGVLQLLAVSYFVCGTLEAIFMKPHSQDTLLQAGHFAIFKDFLDSWRQWLIMACIVITHTCITFLLPVPNCPKGYFGPGGKYHFRGKYENCTAGAAGYIDRLIFGNHTYPRTHNSIYGTISRYDPEGLMNTISAIFIVYLGVHAGRILLLYYQCHSRMIRWFLWAVVTGIIAGILCNFEMQDGVIPVVKKMMTLSYVLACSSLAFALYTVLYFLIDHKQIWGGDPFIYAGTNPIFLYVGHILTKDLFPWAWKIEHPTHTSVLAMNLWTTSLWAIIAYFLYCKDIIITI